MKKNYSTPEFMLVALDSNNLICTSNDGNGEFTGITRQNGGVAGAKQRNDIWDE